MSPGSPEWIAYDLAKKVPDMRRGFRIETHYGEIDIDEANAKPFADLVERLLNKQIKKQDGRPPLHAALKGALRKTILKWVDYHRPNQVSSAALLAYLQLDFSDLTRHELHRELDYLALRGWISIEHHGEYWLPRLTAAGLDALEAEPS